MMALIILSMLITPIVTSCTSSQDSESQTQTTNNAAQQANPDNTSYSTNSIGIPEIVESISPSIVQIDVKRPDGEGFGSGIIYDSQGHVITNWHVIAGSTNIRVQDHREATHNAVLVREDPQIDLAVIKINPSETTNLSPATFGDSEQLRVGEDVLVVGHAFGLSGEPSVSKGIISGLNRTVADQEGKVFTGLIQTDAAISLGSSGGPLLNDKGEVVGINLGTINLGARVNFAIDGNSAEQGAQMLVSLGKRPDPGYLGVGGVEVNPRVASRFALPINTGFGIKYVDPDSPAATEFKIDDVIVNIDDTPIRNANDFTEFLRTHPEGTDIVVTAVRKEGDVALFMEIPVTLSTPGT